MDLPSGPVSVTDAIFSLQICARGTRTRTGTFLRVCRPAATVISNDDVALSADEAKYNNAATDTTGILIMRHSPGNGPASACASPPGPTLCPARRTGHGTPG